jgi:glycosyltransferase involved in cell wall biosynthesis
VAESLWVQLSTVSSCRNDTYGLFKLFWLGLGDHSHSVVESPFISVVIPVYNAAKFLENTVNSVLCQFFESFEVLCIDDGSSDASAEVVQNISKRDQRVKLIRNGRNRGTSYTRGNGIRNALGSYIFFLDADDEVAGPSLFGTLAFYADITEADIIHF